MWVNFIKEIEAITKSLHFSTQTYTNRETSASIWSKKFKVLEACHDDDVDAARVLNMIDFL